MAGLILFVIGVAGLVLLTRGVVGRRVGGEPRCRQCRYDLSGLDEGAATCPECGRSLRAAEAVQRGLRRIRPIPIVAGSVLLLATIGAAGFATWANANDFNLNRLKPTWMLLDDLEPPDGWGRTGVVAEVRRRFVEGDLGDDSVDRLARVIVENTSSRVSFVSGPQARLDRDAAFIGILIHPGTGEAARSILIARALEFLQQDPKDLAYRGLTFRRAEVVDALDHLLAMGSLRHDEAVAFLKLKIRPALIHDTERVVGGALIPVRLTLDWMDMDLGLNVISFVQAQSSWATWSAWGAPPTMRPVMQVDVVFVGGDAEVISTHEPMRFDSAFDWYVYEAAAIRQAVARGERSAPEPSTPVRGSGVEAALIRAPAAVGWYRVVFDVHVTALQPGPAPPGDGLGPDGSAVEVVHRLELGFGVREGGAEPAADPVR